VAIAHYAPDATIRSKVEEALQELERLAEGTLTAAVVFQSVSFTCACGQINKRSAEALQGGEHVNCIREGCKEQYKVEKDGDEFLFTQRTVAVACRNCEAKSGLTYRAIVEMPRGAVAQFECADCGANNYVTWKLMQADKSRPLDDEAKREGSLPA
jgi:hypothetical protein